MAGRAHPEPRALMAHPSALADALAPVDPDAIPALADAEARPPAGLPHGSALGDVTDALVERLARRQALLTADGRRSVLVVFQARDAGGKDGTIRHVFAACNPQATHVAAFAAPAGDELRHDYLWRVHRALPPRGTLGVFNRSHYEDVLVARVHGLVPEAVWSRRYRHIAEFERMLADEGTVILKFFLHVSRAEQARRLRARLDDPEKNYKYDERDLDDRARWHAYTRAYQDVLARTSAPHAPWFVVPADDKKARNYLVAATIVRALEALELRAATLPAERLEALRVALDAQLAAEG